MSNVKSHKSFLEQKRLNVKIDISRVAKLANLPVNEKEKETFNSQLTKILDHIDKIEEADTENIEPTYNVSSNINITRSDNPGTSLTQDEALQNSVTTKDSQFVTKGVFEG